MLNKVTDGKANQTNYLYDATGRLSGIWAPNYGTVSYRHDAGGRLKEKWLPNGVNSRYAYFTDNTLAQVVNRSLTTTIISQHDYSYDVFANRRQQTSTLIGSALTHTYTFDALDRLLTVKYGGTEVRRRYRVRSLLRHGNVACSSG